MAAEQKATKEEVKMDLFEDDDEFEEFEINQDWVENEEQVKEVGLQWEDDWDDDDVSDDFSHQLRKELETISADKK
ncbi:protein DSS1 HOMOLOG ON CHROMOSOME V-like [Brassica napus]|uniref:protein DSS1 HOMOLOG ON CHROMOSOME V-like n=1 Tax=Brassica napus TaxID=3708 RepID=UPI0006AB485F|nr:protein DSS1 HOMOLOG ON CHROMOSOME V-like [Brassica napus]